MRRLQIVAFLLVIGVISGCSAQDPKESIAKTLDGPLDTVCTVTLYDFDSERPIDEAFSVIQDVDARMSAVSSTSEIAEINSHPGEPVTVSRDTFDLIAQANHISGATDGAFDVTIKPVVALWGIGSGRERIPSADEVQAALSLVDFRGVTLDEEQCTVQLDCDGMELDLGGIAKGYACDAAVQVLERHQVKHALIDLGGNIYAYGTKPDGSLWKVGVQNPIAGENGYFGIISVSDRSVVTSGLYERFFEEGEQIYHHIMDTSTGAPVHNGLLSVTIVDQSSTEADALSTACFVLGLEQGRAYLSTIEGAEGIFVTDDFKVYVTPGISDIFQVADDRFELVSP